MVRVPPAAAWLLARLLPRGVRNAALGDMAEAFHEVVAELGQSRARRWYWGQVAGALKPAVRWPRAFPVWRTLRPETPQRGLGMISESIWQDIRYGARAVSGKLGFSAVVILTLGLAIGATTAIFSVVDGILLRPLPYPQPDRLVSVWADYTRRDGPLREWLSYPNFHDLRQERSAFSEVAIYTDWAPTLTGNGDPELVQAVMVTAGMFATVLQQAPALGRGFTPEDDEPGAEAVVLLSHGFWTRRFGADPDILGTTVMLDDEAYVVVGVTPEGSPRQAPFWEI